MLDQPTTARRVQPCHLGNQTGLGPSRWLSTREDLAAVERSHRRRTPSSTRSTAMEFASVSTAVSRLCSGAAPWLRTRPRDLLRRCPPEHLALGDRSNCPAAARRAGSDGADRAYPCAAGAEDTPSCPMITPSDFVGDPGPREGNCVRRQPSAEHDLRRTPSSPPRTARTVKRFVSATLTILERLDPGGRLDAGRLHVRDHSMTGNAPDLHAFAWIARDQTMLLYVDDVDGFGIIGERSPDEACPFGVSGQHRLLLRRDLLRYRGARRRLLQGVFVAGSVSIACPARRRRMLKTAAPASTGPGRRSAYRPTRL